MKQKIVIYESPTAVDRPFITWDLWRGQKVYVVEPVFAFHYRSRAHFYPKHLPGYVKDLIKAGKVSLLTHAQLNSKVIFLESCDKAVEHVEAVFKQLRKKHQGLIQYVCKVVHSELAENAFKTNLAHRLGEFFSMNILLARIAKSLNSEIFVFHPRLNICVYQYLNKIVKEAGVEIFAPAGIRFPWRYSWVSTFENLRAKFTVIVKLFVQVVGAVFLSQREKDSEQEKRQYLLGITVISPRRQLAGNNRGPDFLVDKQRIKPEDVVYFVQGEVTAAQQQYLDQLGQHYFVPRMGRFFSNPGIWAQVFLYSWTNRFLSNSEELDVAALVLFRYFSWQKALQKVSIKNFVTHCDFGVSHIGRNIALKEQGVETWYFTDSMNFSGVNRKESKEKNYRHPWWTYLTYDHFVTWAESITDYFKAHPISIGQYHIVGCLWSGLGNGASSFIPRDPHVRLVIGVFDTGYNFNGIGDYEEGIVFTKDILRLAEDFSDIQILFKSKFTRLAILNADPVFGPQLTKLYDQMQKHPRIKIVFCEKDPSEVIPISDFVISFPFTSTTFEALSMNKLAIWHDPKGLYHTTMYGRLPGVISYGYAELATRVKELKDDPRKLKEISIPAGSPLFDPYRDERALERFRELLVNPSTNIGVESKTAPIEVMAASKTEFKL